MVLWPWLSTHCKLHGLRLVVSQGLVSVFEVFVFGYVLLFLFGELFGPVLVVCFKLILCAADVFLAGNDSEVVVLQVAILTVEELNECLLVRGVWFEDCKLVFDKRLVEVGERSSVFGTSVFTPKNACAIKVVVVCPDGFLEVYGCLVWLRVDGVVFPNFSGIVVFGFETHSPMSKFGLALCFCVTHDISVATINDGADGLV